MTTPQHRTNITDIHARLADQDDRLKALEARLAKYDVIIERLNVLIDVLSESVHETAQKADDAIEGQTVIEERNAGAHRWATVSITLASSTIVGVLSFILGHMLPR